MDESIIKSLFRWFADCDVLEVDNDLNVDYLGEDPEQYSIEVVPCKTVLKQYIDGSAKCQYLFIFASRENYSPDESINIANLEFYERPRPGRAQAVSMSRMAASKSVRRAKPMRPMPVSAFRWICTRPPAATAASLRALACAAE